MTKREAKRHALYVIAQWAANDLACGAEHLCGIDRDSPDGVRVEDAMQEVIAELHRRGWIRDEPKDGE